VIFTRRFSTFKKISLITSAISLVLCFLGMIFVDSEKVLMDPVLGAINNFSYMMPIMLSIHLIRAAQSYFSITITERTIRLKYIARYTGLLKKVTLKKRDILSVDFFDGKLGVTLKGGESISIVKGDNIIKSSKSRIAPSSVSEIAQCLKRSILKSIDPVKKDTI
jgi:hypothetical protein